MKKQMMLMAAVALVAVAGCASWTPKQKEAAVAVGHVTLDLAQRATDLFARLIIARAQSPQDAVDKANWLDSVAGGLRSIETGSDGIVTAAAVGEVVRQFTDPDKVHWSELADQLAASFATSSDPPNVKLETLATMANASAQATRTTVNQALAANAQAAEPGDAP